MDTLRIVVWIGRFAYWIAKGNPPSVASYLATNHVYYLLG